MLQPRRVDQRRISDSILTEILDGIRSSLLVFADVTTIGAVEGRPLRNGNVMYELGIAHACRQPTEVVVFRSDAEELLFDTAHVRVNSYDPDGDAAAAIVSVRTALLDAAKETDAAKALAVQQAADSLDAVAVTFLLQSMSGGLTHPGMHSGLTMGDILTCLPGQAAVSRLLTMGLLRVEYEHGSAKLKTEALSCAPLLPARLVAAYRNSRSPKAS